MQPESPQSKPLQRIVDAKLVTIDANQFFFFSDQTSSGRNKICFLKKSIVRNLKRRRWQTTTTTTTLTTLSTTITACLFFTEAKLFALLTSARPNLLSTWTPFWLDLLKSKPTRRELLRVDFLRLIRRIQLVFIFWVTDLNPSLARQRQPQDVKQTSKLLLWQREPMTIAGAGVSLV